MENIFNILDSRDNRKMQLKLAEIADPEYIKVIKEFRTSRLT